MLKDTGVDQEVHACFRAGGRHCGFILAVLHFHTQRVGNAGGQVGPLPPCPKGHWYFQGNAPPLLNNF